MTRSVLAVVLVLSVSACSSSSVAGGGDGGGVACPALPPAEGEPCEGEALCVYERCASEGVVAARCSGSAGAWSIATSACEPDCHGATCGEGQVCAVQMGGALLHQCRAHACGEGPLECECACGSDRCEIYEAPREGALFGCYLDCGAEICP